MNYWVVEVELGEPSCIEVRKAGLSQLFYAMQPCMLPHGHPTRAVWSFISTKLMQSFERF